MDNSFDMEHRLWEYIDGFSEGEEKSKVEQLIREQEAWSTRYAELLEVHRSLNLVELEAPSMRFTKNVMEEIARLQIAPATKNYINSRIIWGIGAFFITVIVGFLLYGFAQIDWSTASDPGSIIGVDLTEVDYSKMFNNTFVNAFIMMNMILGLMLFDRYLNNQKKKFMGEGL